MSMVYDRSRANRNAEMEGQFLSLMTFQALTKLAISQVDHSKKRAESNSFIQSDDWHQWELETRNFQRQARVSHLRDSEASIRGLQKYYWGPLCKFQRAMMVTSRL